MVVLLGELALPLEGPDGLHRLLDLADAQSRLLVACLSNFRLRSLPDLVQHEEAVDKVVLHDLSDQIHIWVLEAILDLLGFGHDHQSDDRLWEVDVPPDLVDEDLENIPLCYCLLPGPLDLPLGMGSKLLAPCDRLKGRYSPPELATREPVVLVTGESFEVFCGHVELVRLAQPYHSL